MVNFFPHALTGISESTLSSLKAESTQLKSTYAIPMTIDTTTFPLTNPTQKTQPTIKPGTHFQLVIHRPISKILSPFILDMITCGFLSLYSNR